VDKKREIMDVAVGLLAQMGFYRVPMSMIAERAQVAVGTIYLYFPSKDALIEELFRDLEGRIVEHLREGYPEGAPVRERFLFLAGRLCRYFIENPLHFSYMEQFFNSPDGISVRRDKLLDKPSRKDVFRTLFAEAKKEGMIKDLPLNVVFSLAIAPVVFLLRDHVLGFIHLDDTTVRQTAEACWDAIRK